MTICQILVHAEKKFPPSMHQFLDDIFNIVVFKIGACKKIWQIGLFTIFVLYFNILSSKVVGSLSCP